MSVSARVIRNLLMPTLITLHNMATQRGCATLFNGRQDFELIKANVALMALLPGTAVGAEDIRDLQTPGHYGR